MHRLINTVTIFISLVFCFCKLTAYEVETESQQQQVHQLKVIALTLDAQKFGDCLAQMTEEIHYQELVDLISFIQNFACENGKTCKAVCDMIDYLIIAASGYAYDRQPALRDALQAHIVHNALINISGQELR